MSLIADPVLCVMVDQLLERGAVLDVWTDEEAEACRLVAFDLAQRRGGLHGRGKLRRPWGAHWWSDYGPLFAIERTFSTYDAPDFALSAGIDGAMLHELARGKRLPAKFRPAAKRLVRGRAVPA